MTLVCVVRDGDIATITLNRPEKGNAIDMALALALAEAAEACAADPAIRCVVLTGAGKLFCAGGDVGAFAAAGEGRGAFLGALAEALHRTVRALAHMPKPLLTLVNGPAAGAGLSLAILGDVVIASERAHFTAAYGQVGLTPDGGMSWLLPRTVGMKRAQGMIVANRRVLAAEALAIGLVSQLAPDAEFEQAGVEAARQLATAPTGAVAAARALLLAGGEAAFDAHLDREAEAIAKAASTQECSNRLASLGFK